MKYPVKENDAGKRLDKFLVEKLKNKTRSEIQKIILSGRVLVGGEKKSNHYALKAGESAEIKPAAKEIKKKIIFAKEPEIVFSHDDYLVLNKPAGLIVHGAPHIKEAALSDWLIKKFPKIKKVGEDPARPGIMHRLDQDASGLLVVAKNNKMFFHLKKQFQERQVEKEYAALVYGDVSKETDDISFKIKRAESGHKQAAMPEGFAGESANLKEAFTEFNVEKRFANYTLLAVKIKSGRKHQIRVHFYAYGHPLVGDDLYGTRRTKRLNKELNLGRIFLVARRLSFFDLSGEKKTFAIPLPPELKDFLKKIT